MLTSLPCGAAADGELALDVGDADEVPACDVAPPCVPWLEVVLGEDCSVGLVAVVVVDVLLVVGAVVDVVEVLVSGEVVVGVGVGVGSLVEPPSPDLPFVEFEDEFPEPNKLTPVTSI